MSDPQTTIKREILELLCSKAVAPETGPAAAAFIVNAASAMFEPPKWGGTTHVEAIDPLITCLNDVYEAVRLDPSNAPLREAAAALEAGIRRLTDLNDEVNKRDRRRAGFFLDAVIAAEDQA